MSESLYSISYMSTALDFLEESVAEARQGANVSIFHRRFIVSFIQVLKLLKTAEAVIVQDQVVCLQSASSVSTYWTRR